MLRVIRTIILICIVFIVKIQAQYAMQINFYSDNDCQNYMGSLPISSDWCGNTMQYYYSGAGCVLMANCWESSCFAQLTGANVDAILGCVGCDAPIYGEIYNINVQCN
jgi:hypothetical protein